MIPNSLSKSSKLNDVFIFLLIVCSLNFFSAKYAQTTYVKSFSYTYILLSILISFPYFFRKICGLIFPIQLIIISIILSIIMSYISWGQSFTYSLSTIPYLVWFIFFFLLHKKYPINKLENFIVFYGFVYILMYIFQFLHNDVVYFGFKDEFIVDRGVTRINFPGAGVFFLGYFISLNRSSYKLKFRWLFILFLVLGVIVTILQVTRQNIALIIIPSLFHYIRKISLIKKVVILSCFFFVTICLLSSENPISQGLLETQKETALEGNKYIRVLSGSYFMNDFSPNTISKVFGNGFPNNTSSYGRFTTYLEDNHGYYLTDVGIIGFYAMFGVFSVIGYIFIFGVCLTTKVPEKYYYLKYYIWLLLITSLTSDYIYSINFLFSNIIVFYCFQLICEEKKRKSFNFNNNQIYNEIYNRYPSV